MVRFTVDRKDLLEGIRQSIEFNSGEYENQYKKNLRLSYIFVATEPDDDIKFNTYIEFREFIDHNQGETVESDCFTNHLEIKCYSIFADNKEKRFKDVLWIDDERCEKILNFLQDANNDSIVLMFDGEKCYLIEDRDRILALR